MAMVELNEKEKKKKVLSTGNTEIDKKMADGLPVHSLNLIEGANDTGKSVLTQQITWGGLNQGHTFAVFTTENTIKSFLQPDGEPLARHHPSHFAWGYLKIYPDPRGRRRADAMTCPTISCSGWPAT